MPPNLTFRSLSSFHSRMTFISPASYASTSQHWPLYAKSLAHMMVPLLILTLFRTRVANSFLNILNQTLEYMAHLPPLLHASLFLLIYIFSTVFLLPATVLAFGAGYIFGIPRGLALVSLSSTTVATVALLLAGLLGRNLILDKILSDRYKHRFNVFSSTITHTDGGAKIVLTRFSPVFPFGVLNYTFGIIDKTLSSYVFASWLGMLLGSLLFVYFGSIIGEIDLISRGAVTAAHQSVSSLSWRFCWWDYSQRSWSQNSSREPPLMFLSNRWI